MTTIAQAIANAAEFTSTAQEDLIDAGLIAAQISGKVAGIDGYKGGQDELISLIRTDGETMSFGVEIDTEEGEETDTFTVAGWLWAITDTEDQITDQGGAPLTSVEDLEALVAAIEEWAANA